MREYLLAINRLVYSDRYLPRWGWHDDHRANDRSAAYLPALQQIKAEFAELVRVIADAGLIGGNCLQLGMGECNASHEVWMRLFNHATTISWRITARDDGFHPPGGDTHDPNMRQFASHRAPYDFLFIDAGHDYEDVRWDYADYGPMVRPGGIIAFHDALKRPGFEEVTVWRYLETLGEEIRVIGSEVGISWLVKR